MSKRKTIKIDKKSFEKDSNKLTVSFSEIKQRKTWKISPVERIHNPKNKETRLEVKQSIKKALRDDLD